MYLAAMKKPKPATKGPTTTACEDCGKPIPKERLKALPHTPYCVRCAERNPPPEPNPDLVCDHASTSARNGFAGDD